MHKIGLFLFFIFLISFDVSGQRFTVRGRVTDTQTGEPIIGATVHIKGTHRAAITDGDGRYHLHPQINQVLVFSFLGYEPQEVEITEDTRYLNVDLQPVAQQIDEVLITGALGIRRASREIGGGAQVVSHEEMNQGQSHNPLAGLSGRVSGLRVNMFDSKVDPQFQVVMRGTRSLRGNNAPLYVVDGVPVPEINRINPGDIAEITVLKGANAAALYGSEGVNGVIMITTHQGTKGGATVLYNNATTFSRVYQLPAAQNQFGQGVNGVYDPTQFQSWGPAFDGSERPIGLPLADGTQPTAIYAAPDRDVRKDMFDTGINIRHDLSVAGGDDFSSYYLSLSDVTVKGIIPDDESRRTGIRLNSSRRFNRLTSSFGINYVFTQNNTTPDGPWVTMYQMPANFPHDLMSDWEHPNSPGNPNNFFTDRHQNPYFQIDNRRNELTQQLFNGHITFDYRIAPWINATYRAGLYSSVQEIRNTVGKFEADGRRNVNGSVSDGNSNVRRLNSDLMITFTRKTGDFNHRLLLGSNVRSDYSKSTSIGASNLLLPSLYNPGSRVGDLNGSVSISEYRQAAVYGEYSVNYNQYLFLNFTGRNEWVSVLSKENRAYFYPGISTSFVFNEAIEGLQNLDWLNFGKIFLSYNRTGNVNLSPYALNNAYSQSNGFPFDNLVGFTPSNTYPNPDIEPEFVTSWEIGTQLALFNNRLNIEAAYIYSDSEGQIFPATTSRATGYSTAVVNAGRLTNNIIELTVGGDVVRAGDFTWNMNFNFSYTHNEVKELFEGLERFTIFRQSYATIGERFPALHVLDYARDPQGRVIVDVETGLPSPASELTHLGPMVPPYMMGLNTTFSYKNLSLAMLFDCRLGGWMYSEVANRMITAGTHKMTAEFDRQPFIYPNSVIETSPGVFESNNSVYIQNGGDASYWTDHVAPYQINYAAPGDFLKLREISLSYQVPASILSGQNVVREATVGLIATNVFLITHKDNDMGDPEYLYNNTAGYYSWRQVPPFRTFGFNVNVAF
ncbi:SusC/RagA family TonB-linked outer membrane protein [Natronoflexus pectinivorans]|uniref:TonB-linked SusC/RagA family outer membrane protein n=1 Tax=Natronoflexus pectinivorans TaxID=682526 RepID=A0A4R2GN92_9BACT|nr:SusC/RagA family TonB-linked outer membrane protein [Natronoflexus pectinivorans]TCO10497.1 TonB-linked SusC/RagA family outer membrane protein [Natronoflexus pectinivorans]